MMVWPDLQEYLKTSLWLSARQRCLKFVVYYVLAVITSVIDAVGLAVILKAFPLETRPA